MRDNWDGYLEPPDELECDNCEDECQEHCTGHEDQDREDARESYLEHLEEERRGK
jgi:hypothetical protein